MASGFLQALMGEMQKALGQTSGLRPQQQQASVQPTQPEQPANYLQAAAPLTRDDMLAYMRRDPRLSEMHTPVPNFLAALTQMTPQWQQQRQGQMVGEGAAVADPFASLALRRLIGMGITPLELINESHGLVNR